MQWRDPDARRTGEHLARFGPSDVEELRAVGRKVAGWIAPAVIERWVAELGYVPLFVDGSQIEVQGRNFEGAAKDYKGDVSFQLGAAFLGELQVSGRLGPGNADAAGPWREQLERDVEPLLEGVPVWGRMDNAYYRKEVVEHFEERGWDYSISVTSATYKSPILEAVDEVLEEADWGADQRFRAGGLRHVFFAHLATGADLRGGAPRRGERLPAAVPDLHGDPGVARRPAAEGAGGAAPRQAGPGERVQGPPDGDEPAPSALRRAVREPGLLRVRADRPAAGAGDPVQAAAGGFPGERSGLRHAARDAHRGHAGPLRRPAAPGLRALQLAAGLALVRGRPPRLSQGGTEIPPTPRPRLAQRRLAYAFGARLARKTAFPRSPTATDAKFTPHRAVRRRRSVDFDATRSSEPRCAPQFDETDGNPKNGILNRVSRQH